MAAVRLTIKLQAKIDRTSAQRIGREAGVKLVTGVQRKIFNRSQVLTPVDTGNLRGHNRMGRLQASNTRVRGEVFNDANYAEAVHDGTQAHTITANRRARGNPRRPGALKFKIGGRTIYRRSVQHPGTRGRPWLERAGRETAAQAGFVWERG